MALVPLGLTLLVVLAVAALVLAERRQDRVLAAVSKPVASLGFVGLAVAAGATASTVGWWILIALVLSLGGDVLLLWRRSPPHFIAGLASFLLGHVAFGVAFAVRGVDPTQTLIAFVVLAAPAVIVTRWLLPHLRERPTMKGPVLAYIAVITSMVALAWGAFQQGSPPIWMLAAALFYVSDLAVARERFVVSHFHNRLFGLPVYYAAQVCFAWGLMAA